jgi:DNA-binding NarL/FixJ family response regulator
VELIILEDHPLRSLCTQDALEQGGLEVLAAISGAEAFDLLSSSPKSA